MVVFAGEYDFANKSELRKEFSRLHSVHELVLDMSEVTYMDSTFIAELLLFQKARKTKRLSGFTIIAPPKSLVRKLFQVTGLLSVLNVVEAYKREDGSAPSLTLEYAGVGRPR